MVARRKMDNRFGPGERCRQPIPGTDIASVQWNIGRTAFVPPSHGSLHVTHPLNFRERTKNLGGGEDRLEILCRPDISRKHHTKTVRNLAPFRCVVLQTHRAIELLYAVGKIMNPFCIFPNPLDGLKKTSGLHQNLITTLIDESDQSLYNPQNPLGGKSTA